MTPLPLNVTPQAARTSIAKSQMPLLILTSCAMAVIARVRMRRPVDCSTPQSPAKQIFLNSIRHPPQIIPHVLRPPAGEKLRRLESALGSLRESQFQCALGQSKLIILREPPLLHVLNLSGQALESFRHFKSTNHDLVDDIAPMTHTLRGKGASRDDQTVGADDPKDPDAQLIGTRPVVAVQEKDLQHRIIELDRLKPPAESHDVSRVQWARRSRVSLACIDRHKAHVNQSPENPFRRNEGVLGAHALVSRRGKHRRRS